MSLLLIFLACFAARAQSPLGNFLGPPAAALTYEGRFVAGDRRTPEFTENRLSLVVPAHRDAVHTVTPGLTAARLTLGRSPVLSTGRAVPRELSRLEVGAQYVRQLERGRNWGVRAAVGYAGDRPFAANEDLTYAFAGTYGFPGHGTGYWILMVLLSNNGVLPNYVPIPGFLYVYRTPEFTGIFGLPILSLAWTPRPWALTLTAFGPLVRGEAAVGRREVVQGFAEYAVSQQVFITADRARARDRLNFGEQRAAAGVRAPLGRVACEVKSGVAFGRSISVGRGYGDRRGGKFNLGDELFVGAQTNYAF